jgi:hypothetical protein
MLQTLFFPTLLSAQGIARDALSSFPADTQQLAYVNLAQLRGLADYPQIRQRLLNRQLRDFEDFLRSMGVDPEEDVDEVVLGWRGPSSGNSSFFGLACGRFRPDKTREFFTRNKLSSRQYSGLDLYAFGSGEGPGDLFFAFLTASLAAFGRLGDLKALLDVYAGTRLALESNSAFVSWEAELEGTAAQWGITTGKAVVNQVAPWLAGRAKLPTDLSSIASFVQTVLYRIDWESEFSAHISIVCHNPESASTLGQLLLLWKASTQATAANAAPATAAFIQTLDIEVNGPRVELRGSGSVEVIG